MKALAIQTLNNNIERINNSTRKNNIKNLIALADKYFTESDIIDISNVGTIAEALVIKIIESLDNDKQVARHNNPNASYDLTINNRKAEIKCCLNGASHTFHEPTKLFVLAKSGLYIISKKESEKLVGLRIENSHLQYKYKCISMKALLN